MSSRGGSPGFLRVLDDRTLGFADFGGNHQYITLGNLSENPKAFIFLMDYANQRRVKLWGTARVVEGEKALEEKLRAPARRYDLDARDIHFAEILLFSEGK